MLNVAPQKERIPDHLRAMAEQDDKSAVKEANANCVMSHRRQFLAELVVATIVADGAESCCSVSHCAGDY